ncbi:MAG: hypothetical protein J6X69_07580 [Bacteroidales bacterium]|nr:hypothetical protein [Bacteroidales bacterium]
MKNKISILLLAALMGPCALWGAEPAVTGQPVKKNSVGTEDFTIISLELGSYNKEHRWEDKVPGIAEMVKVEAPAVVGFQSASTAKVEDLDMVLDGYDSFGDATDDGETKGRINAIYWRKDCLKLVKSGTFWLGESPDMPGSIFDGASQACTATWGIFTIKSSGRKFFFLHTSLDVNSEKVRPLQAKLILSKMAEYAPGLPCIVAGDYRSFQAGLFGKDMNNPCVVMVQSMIDARRLALSGDEGKTVNHFGAKGGNVKDFVFYTDNLECLVYDILTNEYAGIKYLAIHNPIKCILRFRK